MYILVVSRHQFLSNFCCKNRKPFGAIHVHVLVTLGHFGELRHTLKKFTAPWGSLANSGALRSACENLWLNHRKSSYP